MKRLTWQERAEAVKLRRRARGEVTFQPGNQDQLPATAELFDCEQDIAAHPFTWTPEASYREQVSHFDLETCNSPGCDRPIRKLARFRTGRPLLCLECSEPDGSYREQVSHFDLVPTGRGVVNARTGELLLPNPGRYPDLPAGQSRKPEPEKQATATPRRQYTVNDTREVIWLYRNKPNMSMANIADSTGVPAATVRQWVKRHAKASDDDSLYLQRPPSDGRLRREAIRVDAEDVA